MYNKEEILKQLERMTIKIKDGCWLHKGRKDSKGYVQVCIGGRKNPKVIRAHRLSAWIFLNLNLDLDERQALHITECPNKNCWNPEHIYLGSASENLYDRYATGWLSPNKKKTHCPQGHEYNKENTLYDGNNRHCRICMRARDLSRRVT